MKKTIAILLLSVMILAMFISCANSSDDGKETDGAIESVSDTAAATEAETEAEVLEIPDEKFNDLEFVILSSTNETWNYSIADFDEPSDDPLANALYERNRAVEEMLGCTISQNLVTGYYNTSGIFGTAVDGGDTEAFDVAAMSLVDCGANVGAGRCYDLSAFQYLDLTKSWWDQASVEQLAIGGNNYMVAGEVLYSDKELLWLMFFTKQMITDYGLENPYELVANNEWTWDKMVEMIEITAYDENANGVYDDADIYGLCTHMYQFGAMWISAEQRIVTLDEDGIPYQTWGEESFITVYEELAAILDMDGVCDDNADFIQKKMKEGKTLFAGECVSWVSGYRDNEYDFGLLPVPKYSKDQDQYYTFACDMAHLLVVGNNQTDTYSTGIILEALAAKGKEIMLPMYYEKQLQSRHARDEESSAMLDIIFQNRVYDLGAIFNWSGVANTLMHPGANPATMYASHEKAFRKAMEKSLENILG